MATRVGGFTVDYTCGCCGEGAWLLVGDCQSLTGTATLCGHSGFDDGTYDPDAPEAWAGQYRKWRDLTRSGSNGFYSVDSGTSDWVSTRRVFYGGTISIALCEGEECESTCTTTGSYLIGDITYSAGAGDPEIAYEDVTNPGFVTDSNPVPGTFGDQTYVVASLTNYTISEGTPSGGTTPSSDVSVFLTEEVYFYDALADLLAGGGDVEEGEECCTTLTEADLTSPNSTAPITMTGTAVRVPITIMGCTPVGVEMSVYITLSQGESTYEVEIGLKCMVPAMVYIPLAGPGQDPICFERASLTPS
jgi:hypothetical protein